MEWYVILFHVCIINDVLNLNLNSLLVKHQSESLSLIREVNLDTQSFDNSEEEIRDSGRSFQSKEAIPTGVFTSRGYLKGHRVLIFAEPCLWNKVICRYPGFTFQT